MNEVTEWKHPEEQRAHAEQRGWKAALQAVLFLVVLSEQVEKKAYTCYLLSSTHTYVLILKGDANEGHVHQKERSNGQFDDGKQLDVAKRIALKQIISAVQHNVLY